MKRIPALLNILAVAGSLAAQNLVMNPSFEAYTLCPNGSSAIANATNWQTAKNSPEYLNACSGSIYSTAPTNYFGYQAGSTGVAYAGGIFYGSFASTYLVDLREYFYVPLLSPLVPGQTYYVQFKINLADNSAYAVNRAGIQFVSSYNSNYPFTNSAHVFTNSVVTDKVGWTNVLGTFVPTVAYTARNVGNFFQDVNCTVQNVGTSVSIGYNGYYFIDDIYVSLTPPVVLPISWEAYGTEVAGNVAKVSWQFEGADVDFYLLESSEDGYAFAEGKPVKALQGQSHYEQLDTLRNHMPTTFYRVRAVLTDGNTHLSPVMEAKRYEAGIDFLLAYPSPVAQGGLLTVEYNTTTGLPADVQIIAIDGRHVRTETFPETTPGHHTLQLPVEGLAPGAYILKAGSLTRKFMVAE